MALLKAPLRLWRPPKPSDTELEARARRKLGITRPEGYRLVKDPWGCRVKVELRQVMEHVALRKDDHRRWELIPLIIPTLKRAQRKYRKLNTNTYEAELIVAHKGGPYRRSSFVYTVARAGEQVFSSILSPTKATDVRGVRKRAGQCVTRSNPSSRDQRPRTLAGPGLGWISPLGASPSPYPNYSTGRQGERRLVTGLAALGVLAGLAWLGGQHERGLVARTFVLQGSSQNAGPVLYWVREHLRARAHKVLGITRPEGYRMVADPWGARVRVDLDEVMNHVVLDKPKEPRYRFIPGIIPTSSLESFPQSSGHSTVIG